MLGLEQGTEPPPIDVTTEFSDAEILSDLEIEGITLNKITVLFNGGNNEVDLGNELSQAAAIDEPHVDMSNIMEAGKSYGLIMVDPDAPAREDPGYRSWMHWSVIGISTDHWGETSGTFPYSGPTPPAGTGPHRYILLAYEVPDNHEQLIYPTSERAGFNVNAFITENALTIVGGNYFTAETVYSWTG